MSAMDRFDHGSHLKSPNFRNHNSEILAFQYYQCDRRTLNDHQVSVEITVVALTRLVMGEVLAGTRIVATVVVIEVPIPMTKFVTLIVVVMEIEVIANHFAHHFASF